MKHKILGGNAFDGERVSIEKLVREEDEKSRKTGGSGNPFAGVKFDSISIVHVPPGTASRLVLATRFFHILLNRMSKKSANPIHHRPLIN